MLLLQELRCVTTHAVIRDCHFDRSVSSNVRYVTCSHGTDCHAESPAGGVHCFKMAKIYGRPFVSKQEDARRRLRGMCWCKKELPLC